MHAADLPAPWSSLIGRERDVEEVAASLASARSVTLTGAGGVGTTRLAVAAAVRAAADVPDGAWWIELATMADAGAVAPALAQALGVRALPGPSELDAVVGYLGGRRALLVLDNCEPMAAEVARVGAALLRACPSIVILATSRAALAIHGETRWALSPLSLPGGDGPAEMSNSDAARLFIDRARRVDRRWLLTDRARRVDRRWLLTDANAGASTEICRQLDGLPLALELAAALVSVLAPTDIARGLDDALGLLSARSCLADARHQTLQASLDWSYGLLPADAQRLLRALGVFADGATLALARRACCGDGRAPGQVRAALETLAEHSLVRIDEIAGACGSGCWRRCASTRRAAW